MSVPIKDFCLLTISILVKLQHVFVVAEGYTLIFHILLQGMAIIIHFLQILQILECECLIVNQHVAKWITKSCCLKFIKCIWCNRSMICLFECFIEDLTILFRFYQFSLCAWLQSCYIMRNQSEIHIRLVIRFMWFGCFWCSWCIHNTDNYQKCKDNILFHFYYVLLNY